MGYFIFGFMFFIIATVSIGNVYADSNDDKMACLELFKPELLDKMCCESFDIFDKMDENAKDCTKEGSEDVQCEDYQCILRKNGMLKDDKIDEGGAKKYFDDLEKDLPKDKSVLDRVKTECLDGKYESYPADEVCPVMKFFVCSYVNIYLECSSWKTDELCTKMADQAKKCRTALGN